MRLLGFYGHPHAFVQGTVMSGPDIALGLRVGLSVGLSVGLGHALGRVFGDVWVVGRP